MDLLFFHRRLRCLVIIDLKIGALVHADIGQMNLYCNYAREHWMQPDEHPPVGLILCTDKDEALARYAMDGLHNKLLVREYLTALPKESELAAEVNRAREVLVRQVELRRMARGKSSCGFGLRSASGESGAEGGEERLAKRSRSATPAAEPQTEARRSCGPCTMHARDERAVCEVERASSRGGQGRRAAREAKQTARWSRRNTLYRAHFCTAYSFPV